MKATPTIILAVLLAGVSHAGQIVTNGKITVSWVNDTANYGTNPPTATFWQRSIGGTNSWIDLLTVNGNTATNFQDSGLSSSWQYFYRGAYLMGSVTGVYTVLNGSYPYPPPMITQPVSVSAVPGQQVTFSVSTTNAIPAVLYQWYAGANPIVGATSGSLTVTAQTNSPLYSVVAANGGGTNFSNQAGITIVLIPQIPSGSVKATP